MGIESPVHLLFIAIVALIVLGPKRLPDLARSLGNGIREFRQSLEAGAGAPEPPAPAPQGSTPEPSPAAATAQRAPAASPTAAAPAPAPPAEPPAAHGSEETHAG